LFGTLRHRKNRYDVNAHVTSATYYSQLSKRSHLQLVAWVAKTCTNMSRPVANTYHPMNNHYNSNTDTSWTNLLTMQFVASVEDNQRRDYSVTLHKNWCQNVVL